MTPEYSPLIDSNWREIDIQTLSAWVKAEEYLMEHKATAEYLWRKS